MKKYISKFLLSVIAIALPAFPLLAEAPSGYYSPCEGKTGKDLLTSLSSVIDDHTVISYKGLWTLYGTSDLKANGKIWDMYSTYEYTYKSDQCGTYSVIGDCYNREHSFPKSWFNDASPMYSDAFHIYPTDGKVNGQRSNHPYGECANGTTLTPANGAKALGKLGKSTFPGYSGTVFEPDDQYKGDFARSYFYMATRYNSQISSWNSDMLAGNDYPAFSDWAINLLLKWHRQDPVSQKEINRNEAIYAEQHNRNPYIDHPELAEYIWGDKVGQNWINNTSTAPVITLPVNGSTIDFGTTVAGYARTATVVVKGENLNADITLSSSNSIFSTNTTTVSKSSANSISGETITLTFKPTAKGSFSGTLILNSGNISSTVNLVGESIDALPVGPVNSLSDNSFVATWSYIGDADNLGEYTLDVRKDGVSIDTYPTSVKASDESFLVEDLEPNTTYTYVVKSEHLTSEEISVTTLSPIPSISILFDGELSFTAKTGEPSEVAELLVDAINITSNITLEVSSPFQLSTDKASWTTTTTLNPEEDRFYLRLFSDKAGKFHSSLVAKSGDYINDNVEFDGIVADEVGFYETFESEASSSAATYNNQSYQGVAALWNFSNAGIWSSDPAHEGNYAVRMGKNSNSQIEMAENHEMGFGIVTLWAAPWSDTEGGSFVLEYTTDGINWTEAGTATMTQAGKTYDEYTFTINVSKPARLRIRQTEGGRFLLDDIKSSPYSSLIPDNVADYHTWDAYCRDGQLVIEASEATDVRIYAIDGTLVYEGLINIGLTTIDTPKDLYIVIVDDFARRVLVK